MIEEMMDDELPVNLVVAQQALDQLSEMYQLLVPEGTGEDFKSAIFTPLVKCQRDPHEMESEMEDCVVSNVDLIRLSCAYLVSAFASEIEGDHENTWVGVSYANYYMGMAFGSGVMAGLTQVAFKKRTSAGGKAAAENTYGEAKRLARRLAEQYLDYNPSYAARQIKDQVTKFQDNSEKKHFRVTSVDTIAGWLNDLPFKGKKGPRGENVKS